MSGCSRASLKETVIKHSAALTSAEQDFLHELCERGNDTDVQVAHDRLLNTDIFLPPPYHAMLDDSEVAGWNGSDAVRLGRERDDSMQSMSESMRSAASAGDSARPPLGDFDYRAISPNTLGSERRQVLLQERKKSFTSSSRLWKAHETGLALSKQASRRSVIVRRNSVTTFGSKREILQPDIFRPAAADVNPDTRRRRVSWTSGLSGKERLPMLPKMRPVLRRMLSDSAGSCKSVTFKEGDDVPKPEGHSLSERSTSMPGMPRMSPCDRVLSTGSVPSILMAAPVSSPMSRSIASVPSLRMAQSVRSESSSFVIRSDGSATSDITESERYCDNYSKEEKKSEWEASFRPPEHDVATLQDAVKLLHTNDPDAPLHLEPSERPLRTVLMRRASTNFYQGEGIEVTDVIDKEGPCLADAISMKTSTSFDENLSSKRFSGIFRRVIRRSLSDDSIGVYRSRPLMTDNSNSIRDLVVDTDVSWNAAYDDEDDDYYDSWKVIEDEYANGYGGGGTLPFCILGTSGDDVDAHPHVLSPPLMESLQEFLPPAKCGDNFWMKYSMVRDGASFHSFLQQARGSKYSILAIETLEGEVFGAFTAEPWRKNWNYFGNGESFLWKMRKSRKEKSHSIIDQAQMESEIDVYPFTGVNHCIQLCTHDKIAVGGGMHESSPSSSKGRKSISSDQSDSDDELHDDFKDHEWGFGLTIESDFLHGTTSPCLTFGSPSLSTEHPSGSLFEIMNLELWTFTPCSRLDDAEKLELGKLFLEQHTL